MAICHLPKIQHVRRSTVPEGRSSLQGRHDNKLIVWQVTSCGSAQHLDDLSPRLKQTMHRTMIIQHFFVVFIHPTFTASVHSLPTYVQMQILLGLSVELPEREREPVFGHTNKQWLSQQSRRDTDAGATGLKSGLFHSSQMTTNTISGLCTAKTNEEIYRQEEVSCQQRSTCKNHSIVVILTSFHYGMH